MLARVSEDAQICWPLQVLFLALRMQLDGIVPQIMSLLPHMLKQKPLDPQISADLCRSSSWR